MPTNWTHCSRLAKVRSKSMPDRKSQSSCVEVYHMFALGSDQPQLQSDDCMKCLN